MRKFFKRKWRIIKDHYNGFEVQTKSWWFPFWHMPTCNSLTSLEEAERWARYYAKHGRCLKELDI